jgi:hypothetical protein
MDHERLWHRAAYFRTLARLTTDESARAAALILASAYEQEAGAQWRETERFPSTGISGREAAA